MKIKRNREEGKRRKGGKEARRIEEGKAKRKRSLGN